MLDVLIEGATVIDGTGDDAAVVPVGLEDGRLRVGEAVRGVALRPIASSMLETSVELDSGRVGALSAEQLGAMVASYYRARGLDEDGCPDPAGLSDLLLD